MKKRYTEEQIIGLCTRPMQGCRSKTFAADTLSEASCYLWRANFGGMAVSDAKKL